MELSVSAAIADDTVGEGVEKSEIAFRGECDDVGWRLGQSPWTGIDDDDFR